jgi:hypothetical protein
MVDPSIWGPATLALTQGISSFNSFLPNMTEIRQHSPDDEEFVKDVRMGEITAAGLTIGVGAIASSLTSNPTPVVVSLVMAFGLIMVYETALHANRSGGTDNALG